MLEELDRRGSTGIFATHLHELLALQSLHLPNVRHKRMGIREVDAEKAEDAYAAGKASTMQTVLTVISTADLTAALTAVSTARMCDIQQNSRFVCAHVSSEHTESCVLMAHKCNYFCCMRLLFCLLPVRFF